MAEQAEKKTRPKTTVVDPLKFFAGWGFSVIERGGDGPSFEMCPALGVYPRIVIDKEASKGCLTKIKKREHFMHEVRVFSFQVGDLFFRSEFSGQDWAQVAACTEAGPEQTVEVHYPEAGKRVFFKLPAAEFARCLETGERPDSSRRVFASERSSLEFLQYQG